MNKGEALAVEYLKTQPNVKKVMKRTKNKLFLVEGEVMTKKQAKNYKKTHKSYSKRIAAKQRSMDITGEYYGCKFYATQKWVAEKEGGGYQGDVFDEMASWIKEANLNKNPKQILVAIVDGGFWNPKRVKQLQKL